MANNWTIENKRLFVGQEDEGRDAKWQSAYWNVSLERVRQMRKTWRRRVQLHDAQTAAAPSKVDGSGLRHG